MPVKVLWTPQAREDLLDIYCLIAEDSLTAAERIFTSIERASEALATHPRMGPRRPDIRPAARIVVEGSYLVLYETEPDTDYGAVKTVTVVRVVDGRRDLTRLFSAT